MDTEMQNAIDLAYDYLASGISDIKPGDAPSYPPYIEKFSRLRVFVVVLFETSTLTC